MLQFGIVVLLLAESVYSAKAMDCEAVQSALSRKGISRFARTFPCSEKYCPLSANLTGCTKTSILNDTQVEKIPTTNQSTTGHSNYEQFISKQDILHGFTTNHAVQSSEAVLQMSVNYTTSGQGSDNRATTKYPISTTAPSPSNMVFTNDMNEKGEFLVSCPLNMDYGNYSCQATCEDPLSLLGCNNIRKEEEACICRAGFLKKGDQCVPPEECSCFMEYEGVIPNGHTYISSDCTRRCQCQSNTLTCDDNYECSFDATCEERDGVRQCYCNDGYTGDGQNCEVIATDCADIYNAGITDSGVYTIKPTNWNGSAFEVYCNMTDGGGWTVFQRRMDGFQNFYLGWTSYKNGFGTPNHELWLGNDKIYSLTNSKNCQLRIDLVERGGSPYYAEYDLFRISDENDNYRLVGLGSYTGNAGYDAMEWHRNRPFSTFDRDNDGWSDYNCAEREVGAWWYGQGFIYTTSSCKTSSIWCHHWPVGSNSCGLCSHSNLNGVYDGSTRGTNIHWVGDGLSGYECSIRFTEMKIRPV